MIFVAAQKLHTFARALFRVRPTVEFSCNPPQKTDVADSGDNGAHVQRTLIQWHEHKWLSLPALQVDVGNAICVLTDHQRDIATGRGQMRCVRAKIYRGLRKYLAHLLRPLNDGREMGMIMTAQPILLSQRRNLVELKAQLLEIVRLEAMGALCPSTNNQMLRPKLGCRARSTLNACHFLAENIVKDEIAPGISGNQLQAIGIERTAQVRKPAFVTQQVAVEQLNAGIAAGRDIRHGPLHIAERIVSQLRY